MKDSYFDGNTLQLVGYNVLGFLVSLVTIGLGYPFVMCLIEKWKASHTVLDGQRLVFDGSGVQLFTLWIKWVFLIFVTLGIYSIFVAVDLEKWRVKHTHFML